MNTATDGPGLQDQCRVLKVIFPDYCISQHGAYVLRYNTISEMIRVTKDQFSRGIITLEEYDARMMTTPAGWWGR